MERELSRSSRLRLALLLVAGGARCRRLVASASRVEDLEDVVTAFPGPLLRAVRSVRVDGVQRALEAAAEIGWRWLVPGDRGYPDQLENLTDPPLGLFVRGTPGAAPAVAVVGSRRATPYGLQVARTLGEELGRAGVVVVSGMARGVDASAHEGALYVGAESWAFWGSGPDRPYPPEHRRLADELAEVGALITEYPPGTPPHRHHFPERNRLIAGSSRATVVVEAAARSGALGTARCASDEGREVFAVPGPIFSATSVGPNTLLRVGARPLLTPTDVLEEVLPEGRPPRPSTPAAGGSTCALLDHLPAGTAMGVDDLAAAAGVEVSEALAEMLTLEVTGAVVRGADGCYRRLRAE